MEDKDAFNPIEPLETASPEIQEIIREVLKLERDRLYQQRPRVNSEIQDLIKKVIK